MKSKPHFSNQLSLLQPSASKEDVISVSKLNFLARDLLEAMIPHVWIAGEISNWVLAASGHAYFLLKDELSQIRCVMFRQTLARVTFALQNGLQIELRGQVSIYEARGEFQINVETVRQAGVGRLFEAFEQLKEKLSKEGLFDSDKKRTLTAYPRAIGLITSPAASVLRDVVITLKNRMPSLPIILYPSAVQHADAPLQLAEAIQIANRRHEVDVLIICRGGGSIEDLSAFNHEIVVRAIASSDIITISGVGHETDVTLCDFVADYRAATPTAAAALASSNRTELLEQLSHIFSDLRHALTRQLSHKIQQLDRVSSRLMSPYQQLTNRYSQLSNIYKDLHRLMRMRLDPIHHALVHQTTLLQQHKPDQSLADIQLKQLRNRLHQALRNKLENLNDRLASMTSILEALDPISILARGYAIVKTPKGIAVTSPKQLRWGDRIILQFSQGTISAVIDKPSTADTQ